MGSKKVYSPQERKCVSPEGIVSVHEVPMGISTLIEYLPPSFFHELTIFP